MTPVDRMSNSTVGSISADPEPFSEGATLVNSIIATLARRKRLQGGTTKGTSMASMTVEATIENVPAVTDFVNEELEKLDCPPKAQTQIDIAIDELFGNIAMYAYTPETGPATVCVDVEEDPLSVIITFIDNGVPFDPLSTEDPDVSLPIEQRKIGGLGVFLVKKIMDDVSYEYREGRNILRIKKSIGQRSSA